MTPQKGKIPMLSHRSVAFKGCSNWLTKSRISLFSDSAFSTIKCNKVKLALLDLVSEIFSRELTLNPIAFPAYVPCEKEKTQEMLVDFHEWYAG